MSGYTPVFSSIYMGTLFGRWPAAAVWASLLPLMNKRGEIDMSIDAICGMTGWPRDLLLEGVRQLMEPDPHSRTPGHDGMRLVPLVPGRPWGWRAVNFAQYREKARLMAKDADRTASGRDAQRKRDERTRDRSPSEPENTSCPPESPGIPLSDADADCKNKNPGSAGDSGSETPIGNLWTEGVQFILSWRTPKPQTESAVRRWVGSLLKSGQWFERSNGHDYPIRDREAKLFELILAAGDKRDPKAYVAGAVKQITGVRLM